MPPPVERGEVPATERTRGDGENPAIADRAHSQSFDKNESSGEAEAGFFEAVIC